MLLSCKYEYINEIQGANVLVFAIVPIIDDPTMLTKTAVSSDAIRLHRVADTNLVMYPIVSVGEEGNIVSE